MATSECTHFGCSESATHRARWQPTAGTRDICAVFEADYCAEHALLIADIDPLYRNGECWPLPAPEQKSEARR